MWTQNFLPKWLVWIYTRWCFVGVLYLFVCKRPFGQNGYVMYLSLFWSQKAILSGFRCLFSKVFFWIIQHSLWDFQPEEVSNSVDLLNFYFSEMVTISFFLKWLPWQQKTNIVTPHVLFSLCIQNFLNIRCVKFDKISIFSF